MVSRSAPHEPINNAQQQDRKSTQRRRLLGGMVHISARDGYAAATVAQVIAHAGVSRLTFYEYFADKDDCFLTAHRDIAEPVIARVRRAVAEESPERALQRAVAALIDFAGSQPEQARFLLCEALAGGPRALDARDRLIAEIEQIIEEAHESVSPSTAIPDLSAGMMVGGIYRLLSSRLRDGESGLAGLLEDLVDWIKSYEQPAGEHRWRALAPAPAPSPSPFVAKTPLHAPLPLQPGRPRISEEEVAENHRQRILFATGHVAQEKGYAAATIADIIKVAGVDRRVFCALFKDKQDAFMAIHELGFQSTMAVSVGAFFAGSRWPERIWEAGRAASQFLETNPTIAHVGFVEPYAVGPGAIKRVEDSLTAFTIFLQEGYQHSPRSDPPSRVALEAIAATNFEIAYHQTRANANAQMSGLLPHVTHLALAPFLGGTEANQFIDEKLKRDEQRTGANGRQARAGVSG